MLSNNWSDFQISEVPEKVIKFQFIRVFKTRKKNKWLHRNDWLNFFFQKLLSTVFCCARILVNDIIEYVSCIVIDKNQKSESRKFWNFSLKLISLKNNTPMEVSIKISILSCRLLFNTRVRLVTNFLFAQLTGWISTMKKSPSAYQLELTSTIFIFFLLFVPKNGTPENSKNSINNEFHRNSNWFLQKLEAAFLRQNILVVQRFFEFHIIALVSGIRDLSRTRTKNFEKKISCKTIYWFHSSKTFIDSCA